ncbi:hypothetical protein EKN56_05925 [Limnobaculum zhutongyuii]|uniref:Phage holin n=1 Tax=Limnobaculum zhutongyuii TaxID=2498113 RepID=A0A411WIG4_9GAMM|nr:putative holin [Limnobaculum zhutongyuii]QBH95979.1 hypothetical protein EKN56_05925 [Limnobaculum zhutongyuii]TQS89311.1 hypothetical protein ELQ32_06000 [Limnobaculum zhutongyuii]
MAEPTSAVVSGGLLLGVAVPGYLAGLDPSVIIASFAGAAVFMATAIDFPVWQRIILFLVSIALGVFGADVAAKILTVVLSVPLRDVTIPQSFGAAITSASAVRVLMSFSKPSRDGESIWSRFWFKKRDSNNEGEE